MKLWRRFRGGHWERWYVDDGRARIWFAVDLCTLGRARPHPGCLGTPTCEDWRSGGRIARRLRLARPAAVKTGRLGR